ncbi:MAG TPA: hypothetical protein V6D10_09895 [Trichocoleus sp.]
MSLGILLDRLVLTIVTTAIRVTVGLDLGGIWIEQALHQGRRSFLATPLLSTITQNFPGDSLVVAL